MPQTRRQASPEGRLSFMKASWLLSPAIVYKLLLLKTFPPRLGIWNEKIKITGQTV
jgi:hypothetical protein